MNRRKPINARQLAREKLLFRYSSALERGDFDIIAEVLREAEVDPILERMLTEINAEYRAELAPPVFTSARIPSSTNGHSPSFSTNHHRATGEDENMNIAYPITRTIPRVKVASRGRWYSAATLAAAIIAIVLFAAVLIARRPPNEPDQANPAVILTDITATPTLPPTFVPTVSPTPAAFVDPGNLNPTLVPDGGIIMPTQNTLPVLCRGTITDASSAGEVNVFSDPSVNGVVVGRIPIGIQVDIIGQRSIAITAVPQTWYYVRPVDYTEGWVSDSFIILDGTCGSMGLELSYETCPTPPPTPTPLPTMPGTTLDPVLATATWVAQPTLIPPCRNSSGFAVTPTAGIPYAAWNSAMLREEFGGIPANTPVRIAAGYFDGVQWQYAVQTLDGLSQVYVPESNLIIYDSPNATPIAGFDLALRSGGYDLVTLDQVGDIPANARVRINGAQYVGGEWLYDVMAKDGQTAGQARESQLSFAPGVTPGAATPTAMFNSAIGMGGYSGFTLQPIGSIPAETRVRIGSAWYNGSEWIYQIQDEAGRVADDARESQLSFAPGFIPGAPTPTAAFFQQGYLITLQTVGTIPAGTVVQATSGYYDGTEWVYGIVTLDNSQYADARASQLRVAQGNEAPFPTFTPTPFVTPTTTIVP
jgi:hypothetical protein